jgi:hypothetical protein
MLTQIESESGIKYIDLLTCISYVINAWKQVSEQTIKNCWAHTGIIPESVAATFRQEKEDAKKKRKKVETEIECLIEKVCANDPKEDRMSTSAYLSFENGLETEGEDENVEVDSDNEDDSDEEAVEESVLTHQQALQVITQLMTYASIHGIDDQKLDIMKMFSRTNVLKGLKQTSILSYFNKDD